MLPAVFLCVMTTIYSIMLKMAAPVTKHYSKAPRTRKVYVMGKKKWYENVYQCAANLNKGWRLKFSLRFIDFVYMLMEVMFFPNLNLQYNGIYIFAQFASYNLSTRKNEVASVLHLAVS